MRRRNGAPLAALLAILLLAQLMQAAFATGFVGAPGETVLLCSPDGAFAAAPSDENGPKKGPDLDKRCPFCLFFAVPPQKTAGLVARPGRLSVARLLLPAERRRVRAPLYLNGLSRAPPLAA